MYLLGFLAALYLGRRKAARRASPLAIDQIDEVLMYGILGVILGGKIGYWVFYGPSMILEHPFELLALWHPGMSFHGGVIGVVLAVGFYAWRNHFHFIDLTDFFMPMIPIGLGLGRIGNFINSEMVGKVTDSPIGMVFPNAGPFPRYPSQLIECLLEGVVLFIVLNWVDRKPQPRYRISGIFLMGYAVARIIAEFFKDLTIDEWGPLAWGWLTMGQLLCVPMLVIGFIFLVVADRQGRGT